METRANYVWVGAVTLGLIALVLGFAVWVARLGERDRQPFDIYFRQSVDGLAKGAEVSYAGVPAGQVSRIELWKQDPGLVRVRVLLGPHIPILQGTTASIQSGFTGVSNIQLSGGVKGAPPITGPGPDGVPVIPTKRSGLGALLSSAPEMLEKLAGLTDRLNDVLSDTNQKQLSGILVNTNRFTRGLADGTPQMRATLTDLHATLAQAQQTLTAFQQVAASANDQLGPGGNSLASQLRGTLKSAQSAADTLQAELAVAKPATQTLTQSTLPQAEAALRELRATSRALRDITEKIDEHGAGALVGGDKLPEYKP